jgi:hypothetical protein
MPSYDLPRAKLSQLPPARRDVISPERQRILGFMKNYYPEFLTYLVRHRQEDDFVEHLYYSINYDTKVLMDERIEGHPQMTTAKRMKSREEIIDLREQLRRQLYLIVEQEAFEKHIFAVFLRPEEYDDVPFFSYHYN